MNQPVSQNRQHSPKQFRDFFVEGKFMSLYLTSGVNIRGTVQQILEDAVIIGDGGPQHQYEGYRVEKKSKRCVLQFATIVSIDAPEEPVYQDD